MRQFGEPSPVFDAEASFDFAELELVVAPQEPIEVTGAEFGTATRNLSAPRFVTLVVVPRGS
ncbi:MAG: hypothetical protein KDC95_02035 [Planctomycetes bacterium]|nr:hypothetical protein [Planctomycetota bacterium]